MKQYMKYGAALWMCAAVTVQAEPDAGIRGYWRMNEGTGTTVADSSGNGNGAVGVNVAWAQGINSAALNLKTDGCLTVKNNPSLSPANALTVEAWVRPWKPNFNDQSRILDKKGSYVLSFVPGKKVGIKLWLNGKEHLLSSKCTTWKDGEWVFVSATYDGQTIRLYCDGVLDNELGVRGKVDGSKSDLYIGSEAGNHVFWNPIDEVRVAGRAMSAAEINKTYQSGKFDVSRMEARFTACYHKGEKRVPKAVVPGTIWIDAEDFTDYGGWWMDTQFVPQMGSPYLLAAGIGEPVADATTKITVEKAGAYTLWVRNRNWIKEANPGTFEVLVNGQKSATTFGTTPLEEWVWQKGGTFELNAGEVELALHDLTGFYGRCDALILTKDTHYKPPFSFEGYKGEQRRLTGCGADITTVGEYDVVVVGAGVAGCNAAIASARTGAKTVLIQNRPMIGGNNSSELGVPVLGPADYGQKNARETGLNEEIGRLRSFNFMMKWSQGAEVVAAAEPNLTVRVNTHVYDVERQNDNRITAVQAFDMITGQLTRYVGKQFIDCTGDGWVGYYAGAESMRGRESRDAFGESNAPEEGDILTMSGSLFQSSVLGYTSKDTGEVTPYEAPAWLWDFSFNTKNLEARKRVENTYRSGSWWHEGRNDLDDLWDPEAARDALIRGSLSYWNWVKNVSPMFKDKAANRVLTMIPVTNAKRETVRLVGDHIMTQDEAVHGKPFADAIAYGGWGLDIHHPEALFSTEGPFDYNTHVPLYNIPFRILYSKNIPNLLMAGRNVSCSHVALGTLRVQATTGVMGQAAGTAAAMCVAKDTDPRGIYQDHITELQQQLLRDDQYIIGLRNEDPNDLALMASVTASSEKSDPFSAHDAINGITRVVGDEMNMWASDPEQAMPQWLQLDLKGDRTVNEVRLTFDTDVSDAKRATNEWKDSERMPPETVRDYQVQVLTGNAWKTVAEVTGNYQRHRIHRFPPVPVSKIKVVITATNGDPSARIYEIRAYNN